jgi:acyl carrier protein
LKRPATVSDRVRQIIADVSTIFDARHANIVEWSSLQLLTLVMAVEEQFELQFEPEEVDEMKNTDELIALVERKWDHRR